MYTRACKHRYLFPSLPSIYELAAELDCTIDEIMSKCKSHSVNLPFGADTVLHVSVADKLRDVNAFDQPDDDVFMQDPSRDFDFDRKNNIPDDAYESG